MKRIECPPLHHFGGIGSDLAGSTNCGNNLVNLTSFPALTDLEENGWLLQSDNHYIIDWKSPEVQQNIRQNIEFLTKGCSCKTFTCGCRKGHKTADLDVCVKVALTLT